MKIFVVLVVVACVVGLSECGWTPEQKETMKQKILECGAKEGASDAEIQDMLAHNPPTTHGGKCVGACVGESFGMSKNNKVDVEGFVALSSKMDPTKADLAREIATTCADITDADRCEAAFKGYHCLHETAIAKGISPSDM